MLKKLIIIIDYIFNDILINTCIADINNDMIINVTDIIYLIEYILSN